MASHENSEENKAIPKKYVIPASVLKRLFAFVIDLFIVNIFIVSPFNPLFASFASDSFTSAYDVLISNPEARNALSLAMAIITIMVLLYFCILQIKFGQTIGMMILNIYVIKVPDAGVVSELKKTQRKVSKVPSFDIKPGFLDSLIRNLFLIPFFPFMLLWLIDPLFMFLNKNSQRLMEVFSKTLTVEIVDYESSVKNQQRWF